MPVNLIQVNLEDYTGRTASTLKEEAEKQVFASPDRMLEDSSDSDTGEPSQQHQHQRQRQQPVPPHVMQQHMAQQMQKQMMQFAQQIQKHHHQQRQK